MAGTRKLRAGWRAKLAGLPPQFFAEAPSPGAADLPGRVSDTSDNYGTGEMWAQRRLSAPNGHAASSRGEAEDAVAVAIAALDTSSSAAHASALDGGAVSGRLMTWRPQS